MNPPPLPEAADAGAFDSRIVIVDWGGSDDDLHSWYATDVPCTPPPTTTMLRGGAVFMVREERASVVVVVVYVPKRRKTVFTSWFFLLLRLYALVIMRKVGIMTHASPLSFSSLLAMRVGKEVCEQ
eukprot:4574260-Ditylum_brightwellii.AAC.1